MTVREAAEMCGYEEFDCALPVDWANDVKQVTGVWPVGHVVWVYRYPGYESSFGKPMPITKEGKNILRTYHSCL